MSKANDAVVENEADTAWSTYDAVDTFWAQLDVPWSDPVNEPENILAVTLLAKTELRLAAEPDTMTFFQFGISITVCG